MFGYSEELFALLRLAARRELTGRLRAVPCVGKG